MQNINVKLGTDPSYEEAERAARNAASEQSEDFQVLTAWYDTERHRGAPSDACAEETIDCARQFATSHGAELTISVNDGRYEFFFARRGEDVAELDEEELYNIHRGIGQDELENVQGG